MAKGVDKFSFSFAGFFLLFWAAEENRAMRP
jgi:hypothetical protein